MLQRSLYHPIRDLIQLPTKAQLHDQGGYYATTLHKLRHWTGHQARGKREGARYSVGSNRLLQGSHQQGVRFTVMRE
ncbi:hypothetical protein J3P76_10500 [Pseudomonas sp. D1-36]